MRIEKRIKKLEKKIIVPDLQKYHIVTVNPGGSEEEEIEKYKAKNEIDRNDKIFVIRYISPKGSIKNDPK